MPSINLIPNDYILRKHPDITWRKWLQMVWNDIEWPIVIFLGLASLALGIAGFLSYSQQEGKDLSFWDSLYLSLQLFSMQVVFEAGIPIPTFLKLARFLSPALAAYTLSQAFVVIFQEQLELFRLVRTTNHVIVCGLGRKGSFVVKDLRKANRGVVVIERDANNPRLNYFRELGAITLVGDARDSQVLLKAGAQHASHLISTCGEDGTNIEIAEQARKVVRGRKGSELTCIIQIINTNLWTLLREHEFSISQTPGFRLEFFNIYDAGARLLLEGNIDNDNPPKYIPHLLIIGMGNLGEHLIRHATRKWGMIYANIREPIRIFVIDPDAKQKIENLKYHFPASSKVCNIFGYNIRTNSLEFQKAEFLDKLGPNDKITHVFICFDDSSLGLDAAATLVEILNDEGAEIMIRMNEDTGLATFLRESHMTKSAFRNLKAFGLLERTCKIGLFDDGTHEELARVIHKAYLEQEEAKGFTSDINKNLVPWNNLSEEIRQSNRHQADHIGIKLNKINCGIMPWKDFDSEVFAFTSDEIEELAKMEHQRWCEEKTKAGWKYHEPRDDNRMFHPDLLPWDDPRFTEEAKEKDRSAVKLIPELLARAGFQIFRIKDKSNRLA